MNPDDMLIIVVIGIIIILTVYYIFGDKFHPIHNKGRLPTNTQNTSNVKPTPENSSSSQSSESSNASSDLRNVSSQLSVDADSNDQSDSSIATITDRSSGGHNAPYVDGSQPTPQKYRHVSYKDVDSGKFAENNMQFMVSDVAQNNTDKFVPVDESGGENAAIRLDESNKNNEAEKYNVDSFLPKEKNKDWFETVDAVDVKNTHLINIYRPIGVNTIGTSLRNASYDLRGNGDAICPQYVVSPWLQSTIQPDRSMKTLC